VVNGPTEKRVERRRLGPFAVSPVGFGAMQLSGPGVFGPPTDRPKAIRLLREVIEMGVDHVDTAQYYGPDVVNQLIHDALRPYPPGLILVSKVGARRDSRGGILTYDQPAQLRRGIEDNLRTLGVDQLPVVNLRLMRKTPPDGLFDDQLAAMIAARDDGLIQAIGLSNVTLTHLVYVLRATDVACVQNAYHLANRGSQPVLDECTRRGIAFVPFAPLASGSLLHNSETAAPKVVLVAKRLGCTPAQVVIAWTLALSPHTLVIPGTSSIAHLRENLAAMTVGLDAAALAQLADTRPDRRCGQET
jgi:aryl-alcohol dehydrogenase-like predicted oxidoreductase